MSADPNVIAADLAKLKADLEAKAIAEKNKVTTWLKANVLHIGTAGGVVATLLKLFGKL